MARCSWPLRRYFRLLWWTLCLLTFIALPLTIWEFHKQQFDVHYQAWFIGGIFVILSMPISIYEIAMHTEYYTQPQLQKHVIRILLMVPIYAVDAWFALRFRKAREYLDPIRECYEAFVIYSFFAYLMAYLQDTYGDLEEHMSKKPPMQHMWFLGYFLKPWDMGTGFLWECKKGVLNYVILRPVCTGLAFITDVFGKYGEGQIDFKKSYVYLAAITNFSQLWALYCLVMLYTAMHTELAPIRPLSKFLCIKAVVFVTFWQGIAIAILVYAGIIRDDKLWYDKQELASGIQDFLICIEMFLAALAHAYAFPPRDYMAGHSKGFFSNVRYIFDLRDVVDDVGLVVEEHVSTATTAVVKVPQRAVKKAAQGLAKNTKKLFGGAVASGNKGSSGRLVDEEEEAASKCALLGPSSPPQPGTTSGSAHGGGAHGSSSAVAWRGGSSGGGAAVERRTSSGGGAQATEALLASYSPSDRLGPLAAPLQQHFTLHDMEPMGIEPDGTAASPPSPRATFAPHLPPLPPASASLGPSGGAAGVSSSQHGSAFNTLITSALYNTRSGYDQGAVVAGGSGAGLGRVVRRSSGAPADQHRPGGGGGSAIATAAEEPSAYGEYTEFASLEASTAVGYGGGGGGEVPLAAVGPSGRVQHLQQRAVSPAPDASGGAAVAAAAGGISNLGSMGSGGSTGSGGGRTKGKGKTEVSVRGARAAGAGGSGGASGATMSLLTPGASSGEDSSSHERLSKRAHDE